MFHAKSVLDEPYFHGEDVAETRQDARVRHEVHLVDFMGRECHIFGNAIEQLVPVAGAHLLDEPIPVGVVAAPKVLDTQHPGLWEIAGREGLPGSELLADDAVFVPPDAVRVIVQAENLEVVHTWIHAVEKAADGQRKDLKEDFVAEQVGSMAVDGRGGNLGIGRAEKPGAVPFYGNSNQRLDQALVGDAASADEYALFQAHTTTFLP